MDRVAMDGVDSMILPPEYINQRIRMNWPEICRMACRAMILNMSLDAFVELAMHRYLDEGGSP
jgi:hypothetical protein